MFNKKDLQAAEQLRRALQLYASTLTPARAREVATVYPKWEPGVTYPANTYLPYGEDANGDPILYQTIQAVTSAAEFPPDTTNTLYNRVSLDESGYPIWSQPTGAHDAYNTGDIVSHNGTLYKSKIDGNVWPPDEYPDGWEDLGSVEEVQNE